MSKYQYSQNQRVYFNLDGKVKGWATICGCATEEMAIIGRNWIIEPHSPTPFDKNIYPFSHLTAFDCQLDTDMFEQGENEWVKNLKKIGAVASSAKDLMKEEEPLPLGGGEDYTSSNK